MEYDKNTSIEENNRITTQIEEYILAAPEVSSVFSNIGGPGTGIGSLGVGEQHKSEFTVQLKSREEHDVPRTEEFMIKLRTDLQQKFPGINFSMATLGLIPRSAPVEITVSGSNAAEVLETSKKLKLAIEEIPGADNVQLSVTEGSPEFKVIPDKDRMQRLGLNTAYTGINLRTAFTGNDDATLTQNGTEYPVRVRLQNFDRKNFEDVANLIIVNPMGMPVEVSQFATIVQSPSPSMLERKDRQPAVTITADALGRPSGTVADDIVAYMKENPVPDGIEISWGSDIKRQQDSFSALISVLLISFILIYLIMIALYDSFIYPFVVLFSIPVAAIGAILALNLSMNNISLFALLGLIMLMGLVVKNAILIVDFTNQLKAQGKHYREALVIAGKERLRPILMTTLSMVFGMLPIAMASGTAAEWKNGLAWVIIGGLMSSLILTVFLVPVVYDVVDGLKGKLGKRFKK